MASLRSIVLLSLSLLPSAFSAINLDASPPAIGSVRGVNLGGWLVLEPWITPSLFDNTGDSRIIDEYTFGQYQDAATATNTLKNHWDTWITEADFRAIAAAGLTHVRIPIGYWAYDVSAGEPYIQGQLPYLTKAINWAAQYQINVIVDLHGAPGSQNGFDNSGQKMSYPAWQTKQSYLDRTNAIIQTMENTYKDQSSVVIGIAPLNEPAGFKGQDILAAAKQYWLNSYKSIRNPNNTATPSNTLSVIHDAFQPPSYWNGFMVPPQYVGVVMDTHIYQMFSDDQVSRTNAQHIQAACAMASTLRSYSLPILVGEWTPAATDCAKYLNGRGVGSRYDGSYSGTKGFGSCVGLTGKASSFSANYKTFLRQYWEAQTSTYGTAGTGWIQWTWKAEQADEWSYQAGLLNGWIPQDPSSRQYPNICS